MAPVTKTCNSELLCSDKTLSHHTITRDETKSCHYDEAVPRWEADPRGRLERAALELFAAQGYDNTTVEQISARAGLARSTFFRHFSDKREILSGGEDGLAARFADSIMSAPAEQTALETIETAFGDVANIWFTPERRDLAPRRIAVIAANPDLAERDLLKRRRVTEAITAALRARGASEPTAAVAAELATLTFSKTVAAWAEPENTEDFARIARRVLRGLHHAAADLA